VASSGTKALCGLFVLYSFAKHIKFPQIFILDEFDAFYHFELAEQIVKMFIALKNAQVVFTSHNTLLLSNRYMRPDCCFIFNNKKLISLPNATRMELREGHNIQKLFIGGEFNE
jgi:AAA15 family ATPase/GTPase